MNDTHTTYLSFTEICHKTGAKEATVIEIIEQGIVEPIGSSPDEWLFSPSMLVLTTKAVRLHRDLNINWEGIALAVDLLDKVERLREENRYLQSRLSRFEIH